MEPFNNTQSDVVIQKGINPGNEDADILIRPNVFPDDEDNQFSRTAIGDPGFSMSTKNVSVNLATYNEFTQSMYIASGLCCFIIRIC